MTTTQNHRFDQVVFASDRLFRKQPEPLHVTNTSVAVIVHLFYPDIWQEIYTYLNALDLKHDLYITLPPHIEDKDIIRILQDRPDAKIYVVENRGRDVLPFLLVMHHIGVDTYRYICKLHTKKTGATPLGSVWRKLLYYDLIGSQETVEKIVALLDSDAKVGQVSGRYTILDSVRYDYANSARVKELCEAAGITYAPEYTFAGGTMFWSKTEIFAPLLELFVKGELIFEEEKGQKDRTMAHAIERFLGILVLHNNMYIAPSPSSYAHLPEPLIEEAISLVLSQQYAGEDLHEKINELIYLLDETRAIAESMRIKNRLKALPLKLLSLLQPKRFSIKGMDRIKRYSASLVSATRDLPSSLYMANPATFNKVLYYLKRGEFRYLFAKIKEKLRDKKVNLEEYTPLDPKSYFEPFDAKKYALPEGRVDIIIPVYNGFEYLERLFDTLKANTTPHYRLIVVNDASPDERVLPYLKERLSEFDDAMLIENQSNLGFVLSVSSAVEKRSGHFVILNTDTELPPLWLERLMYPIFYMPKVASTTPFTNSGTIASFPVFIEDNPIFEDLELARLDSCFREIKPEAHYAHLPTGVGFCMGVNADLIKEIGFFDKERFGKGYGEENDWCQRAIKHGYVNLLVPNLFVYHKHGGSFPSELKQRLLQENHVKLIARHPDYDRQVQHYIKQDPHNTLRRVIVMMASALKEPMWVIFDHGLGGGANRYADDLIETKVAAGSNTLLIRYDFYGGLFMLHHRYRHYEFRFTLKTLDDIDAVLSRVQIKTLFINSLVSYPRSKETFEYIEDLVERSRVELIIPVHDYYPICPSYTLLNEEGEYCGVPSIEQCRSCIQKNKQEWRNFHPAPVDIDTWRTLWGRLLQQSSQILCFSESSKSILLAVYPDISENSIVVAPHKVTDIALLKLDAKPEGAPLTIGILGAINYGKGAQIIRELVEKIDAQNLNINVVVIGMITEPIQSSRFKTTGKYAREDLPDLIKSHQIDIFLIPSIWPETFSYTSEEIMKMGLPLMVFDLGAPAERVRHYDKGYIVQEISADAILASVENINHKKSHRGN